MGTWLSLERGQPLAQAVIVSTSDPSRAPSGVLIIRKPVDLALLLEAVKACARP